MEPSIRRILVFPPALIAHREPRHGRPFPIVGKVTEDRVSRPAETARDEGVFISPVRRVEELGEACRACGEVRRDESVAGAGLLAWGDKKPRVSGWRGARTVYALDRRWFGSTTGQLVEKRAQRSRFALDVNEDVGSLVLTKPRNSIEVARA